jgi:hypothetical protein
MFLVITNLSWPADCVSRSRLYQDISNCRFKSGGEGWTVSAEADFIKISPIVGLSQEAKAEGNYTYRLTVFSCYFFTLWSMILSPGSLRQSQIMTIKIMLLDIS